MRCFLAQTVRVRFAPSPTGYLHVGGARTALYNFLFARKHGGQFILRIEDTDEARSSDESLRMMIQDLKWLDLPWDEGPHPETLQDMGSVGPYKQSQRQSIYKSVADELLKKGLAYYCFLSDEEIDQQRKIAQEEGKNYHIQSPYKEWPLEKSLKEVQGGRRGVVRFRTDHLKKDFLLQDLVRGEVRFPSDMVGDFVLLRSDGMPVYNFCCVVDDHLMGMTHVFRAEEHLPNTLRQLMIYEAMNWQVPQFGHISLVLDEDRQKMSKRRGATSCDQFRREGYLPHALLNFIALLGWSHPSEKEILTLQEMIEGFDTQRLNSSGAVFDRQKLKWMNSVYLRQTPEGELWNLVNPFLLDAGLDFNLKSQDWRIRSLQIFKPYMEVLADAVPLYRALDDSKYEIKEEAKEALTWTSTKSVLLSWKKQLEHFAAEYLSEEDFLKAQDLVKDECQVKGKHLFMPIRVAVIGQPQGTELKILVPLLQKSSLISRVDQVLGRLGA